MSQRLTLALETGQLVLPDAGLIAALLPTPDVDLAGLPRDRVRVVQPFRPFFEHFENLGFECAARGGADCAAAILFAPRAKAQARAMVQAACAGTSGVIVVDGQKKDGIDSLLKEIWRRVPIEGPVAKAHGKIFWFQADPDAFADWEPAETRIEDRFVTAPGVFSADGVDPASALLAASLPARPGVHIADLGAGWGYLSAHLLASDGVKSVDLVEADRIALDCAERNITDSRARFHWADATQWRPDQRVDTVVMNPPFHTERAADPGIGKAFVAAAAGMLTQSGTLWMVANRHLPYEATLNEAFASVREVAGSSGFKVLQATRPSRSLRTGR